MRHDRGKPGHRWQTGNAVTERTPLLPCPFCGEQPRYPDYDAGDNDFVVVCLACGASSAYDDEQSIVIAAWNRRAAENEKLRAAASDMLAELKWIAEKHGYQSTVDIIAKAEGTETH